MADVTSKRGVDLAAERNTAEGRIPPQAVEIEEQILGAMLLEKEAIARVIEVLDDEAFHSDRHRKIYQAILSLFERGSQSTQLPWRRNCGVADSWRRREVNHISLS